MQQWNIDLFSGLAVAGKFDQNQTQTSDGRPVEAAATDCGPASVALIIYWLARVLLVVDEAKDIIWAVLGRTPETAGVTSEYDLMTALQARLGVSCTRHVVTSKGQAMAVIRDALFQGHLIVGLRYGEIIGQKPYHWASIHGGNGPDLTHTAEVYWYQSFGGTLQRSTNDDFWKWTASYPAAGQAVLFSVDAPQRV